MLYDSGMLRVGACFHCCMEEENLVVRQPWADWLHFRFPDLAWQLKGSFHPHVLKPRDRHRGQ